VKFNKIFPTKKTLIFKEVIMERNTAEFLKRRNHILEDQVRTRSFKDPFFVRDTLIRMVDFNKELIGTIEKLEKELAKTKTN
jgi:DNA invertase Pin-like site-specific DNA recombinase